MALVRSLVDGDLEGFRQEFESFLDRCPSFPYYFGTGRFLPAFFFSMFATAHNDGILDENERVYFRFDNHGVDTNGVHRDTGNLKVAVLTNKFHGKQRIVRCYSICDSYNSFGARFSERERNSIEREIIKKDQSLKENLHFEQYKVYMHGKGKSQGEAIATAFEVIREKDFRGGNRFARYSASEVNLLRQLLRNNRLTVKEIEGIRLDRNQRRQLDSLVNFEQVAQGQQRIDNFIEQLASRGAEAVRGNIREILLYITHIYRNYAGTLENDIQNRNQKFESHGFFLGLLANFTHLYAIDIDLDLSPGNSHVAFFVRRQAERENVPVVINLATEGTLSNTALALAIGHAERLHASSFISIHTGSRDAVCVGLNFNLNRIPFGIDTVRLQQGRFPLVQRLFECVENDQVIVNIRDFLLQHLPTEIPRNAENYNRIFDCITGFAFGNSAFDHEQVLIQNNRLQVARYIFRYDNEDHALTMVFHAQGSDIIILHIRAYNVQQQGAINLQTLNVGGNNPRVWEISCTLNNQLELDIDPPNDLGLYQNYQNDNVNNFLNGELLQVPNAENVHDISERVMNNGWKNRDQHVELFRAISGVLMPLMDAINVNSKDKFRSILHGACYACDGPDKVITRYKVGQMYSPDMTVVGGVVERVRARIAEQRIDLLLLRSIRDDPDAHPIGYILKFANDHREVVQKQNDVVREIPEFMDKQRGYRRITRGNEVVLSYAVFNRGAQRAEDLISIPQELYVHRIDRSGALGLGGPHSTIEEPQEDLLSNETRERLIRYFQSIQLGDARQNSILLLDLADGLYLACRYLQGSREQVRGTLISSEGGAAHTSPTAQEILERINAILLRNKANRIGDVHDLLALDFATENQNFRYWLQVHDMFFTARQYNFLDGKSNTINDRHDFAITSVGVNENDPTGRYLLSSHIANFKQKVALNQKDRLKDRLIAIINVGNRHWVTLVIVYQNGNYYGCYADSLGPVSNIDDNIQEALRERDINNVHNVSVHQQTDGYNCGIWVYENARDINRAIDNQQGNNISYIRNLLNAGIGSDTRHPQRNEQYFKDRRGNISQLFKNDPLSSRRNRLIQDYPGIQGEIDPLLLQFLELRYPQRGGGGASQLGGERVISIDFSQSALDEFDGVNRVYDHSKGKGDVPAEEHGRGTGPNVMSGGAPRISDVSRGRGRGIGPNVMSGGVPGVFGERGRNNEPDTKLETPRLSGFVRGYGRGGQL